ncbi:WecB/TagA/CpsF family glycosyltransferase [Paenibacillus urinalis]|uniref:N-acetylglucosaminyldiphosphoundecaprenol N-acetyl-beta-D-mannosaminyltransferase n=1 Tax=Paenibacillus urinalis TaxID=521520 RepID=A0AAX3N5N5_9BACL|nr:WecB/TagA/CpsF family glycosyltransferase [Paenibacillus urinalis]WDH83999.1 WecB/TagA/CpsF family glycosyltransferase [Paenibacillus urinalis]WDH95452.1 WecB/TagA/CpsF family glycosyltransferase [Paenibacillus urinalis]WDI03649.1 WecB/TagA/CpsF family glycosyltransferase [Paenibacillus urinalis]
MENYSKIMGIPVPKLTMTETVQILSEVIEKQREELYHVVTLNPEIAMSCQHNAALRQIVDRAGLLTADGAGIVMVSRVKRDPLPERVTGCDLLYHLLAAGHQKNWSFYLLGADEETSHAAEANIRSSYPGAIIKGRHHGFFHPSEEGRILEEISSANPDILVVALGAPYAEEWIDKHRDQLNARIAIGVGGTLDIIAGRVKRAPRIWQRLNLEWMYRLINQPSRWRRQLILPRFAVRAILYRDPN